MSVSGLTATSDSADMLHQAHQIRNVDAPGDKFLQILDFNNPQFGQSNRVFIPGLEMVVDDMWVEFNFKEPGLSLPAVLLPAFDPKLFNPVLRTVNTQSWLGSSGAQVLYKSTSVSQMSEAEAVLYNMINSENSDQRINRLDLTGYSQLKTDFQKFNQDVFDTNTHVNGGSNQKTLFYMSLRPLCEKVICNAGALSAYAASSWSIDVNLRNFRDLWLVQEGPEPIPAEAAKFDSFPFTMRLFLTGHREDAENAMRVSEALAKDGVKIILEQANHQRVLYGAVAAHTAKTPVTITMSDLEGEATDIHILLRDAQGIIAPTTHLTSAATSPDAHVASLYNFPQSTLEIGTQSNPVRVFGQAVAQKTVRRILSGASYEGTALQMSRGGPLTSGETAVTVRESGAILIALCEKASAGQKFGMFSGSLRLKNDFRATLRWDIAEARRSDVLDIIVYIRRVLVITHAGIIMVNEE